MAREKGSSSKSAKAKAAELMAQIGVQPSPVDDETRKMRLKTLIKLGKERGFLTYAEVNDHLPDDCLLYTSPSPRDRTRSRMPSSA